jgi:hypothetical protein
MSRPQELVRAEASGGDEVGSGEKGRDAQCASHR